MNLKFRIRGMDAFKSFLKSVPKGTVKVALAAITTHYIGKSGRGLRKYEPYKHVSPFRSYSPDPVKAAKQRRWIFAHKDLIGRNNRSGATERAWRFTVHDQGTSITFLNESDGAIWLWSNKYQSRHQKAVGHRTLESKVASNYPAAIRAAILAVNKFLKYKN